MIRSRNVDTRWIALLVVVLSGLGQTAFAFTPGACQQDADKLCPGLSGKEVTPCLKQHEVDLSTACKVNLAEARQMVREAKDSCEPDIKKFCADVQQGGGRIRRCLKAHQAELSSACQAKIAEAKQKIQPSSPESNPSQNK